MSSAPAAPAGAAPAPAGAPPPVEKTPLKTVPKDIRSRVLGQTPKSPTDAPPPPAPPPPAVPPAAPAAGAPAAAPAGPGGGDPPPPPPPPPAGDPAPRVRKTKEGPALPPPPAAAPDAGAIKETVRGVMREIAGENPPAAPTLTPEVEREIELAKFAESQHADRYTGFTDKVKKFYVDRDQLVGQKAKELGGQNSAQFKDYLDSDEFRGWVEQNRPSYVRGDKAKLSEDMIASRARAEATRELQPQLKSLERKTAELEFSPTIKAKTSHALNIILTDPNEKKDPALVGFAKDPMGFGQEHPEEAQLIAAESAHTVDLIEEVYRLDHDLVDFDPAKRPNQQRIREFMQGQNGVLRDKHPNGIEMLDGKILIDAKTFTERGLHKDPRYRIFNADEMAGMLAVDANAKILDKLQKRSVGVTKSIYAKKVDTPPPPPGGQGNPAPDEPPSPGAHSSAAPGTRGKPKDQKSLANRYA